MLGITQFDTIASDYKEPVLQYAATTYSNELILNALTNGWITQEIYDRTTAYKPTENIEGA
ncbi:hypothetical protein D3C72_2223350 [compost metagenome]